MICGDSNQMNAPLCIYSKALSLVFTGYLAPIHPDKPVYLVPRLSEGPNGVPSC